MDNSLKSIINFDPVKRALLPLINGPSIDIFLIHRQSVNEYREAQRRLEVYLKTPNEEEIEKFLKEDLKELELDESTTSNYKHILPLILRLFNFHLLVPINFDPVLKDDLYRSFKDLILLNLRDKKLRGYFQLTIILSIKIPNLKLDTLKHAQYAPDSVKRLKPNLPEIISSPKSSFRRSHHLNSIIGLFIPKFNSNSTKVNFDKLSAKVDMKKLNKFDYSLHFRLVRSNHLESSIQHAFEFNVTDRIISALTLNYTDVRCEPQHASEEIIDSGKYTRIIPDLMITNQPLSIPIELKRKDLNESYVNFINNEKTDSKARDFIHCFSQSIREAISLNSHLAFISDYLTTYLIDIENPMVSEETIIDKNDIMRELDCRIYDLSDESEFSTCTQLFIYLLSYFQTCKGGSQLQYLIEQQNLSSLYPRINSEIIKYNTEIEQFCTTSPIDENHLPGDTPTPPSSSGSIISELQGSTELKITQTRIKTLRKSNLKSTTMEELRTKYKFLEILSGNKLQSRNSIVFLVEDLTSHDRKVIKIYDSFWSCEFQINQDISDCYLEALKCFSKEVSSYEILKGIDGIPKFYSSGFLNSKVDSYKDEFDVDIDQLAGFFLIIEYIDGKPLSCYTIEERQAFKSCCKKTIDMVHNLGIVHHDIHSGNIMIKQNPDGTYTAYVIDFGYSDQANKRKGRISITSPKSRKRYNDTIKCDNDDYLRCFREDQETSGIRKRSFTRISS
ncbi:uncharacterized protein RJT21DRAFT_123290, partial [Scheffersomyces amazonensis]|uniref:uncharacterized protein n=1 Tax=Scheffersomyces amazonensis TaxID=1078765 RepID=UPI00315DECDC